MLDACIESRVPIGAWSVNNRLYANEHYDARGITVFLYVTVVIYGWRVISQRAIFMLIIIMMLKGLWDFVRNKHN